MNIRILHVNMKNWGVDMVKYQADTDIFQVGFLIHRKQFNHQQRQKLNSQNQDKSSTG